jgi:hypothetical protein
VEDVLELMFLEVLEVGEPDLVDILDESFHLQTNHSLLSREKVLWGEAMKVRLHHRMPCDNRDRKELFLCLIDRLICIGRGIHISGPGKLTIVNIAILLRETIGRPIDGSLSLILDGTSTTVLLRS